MQAVSKLTHLIWGQKNLYSLVKVESEKKGDSMKRLLLHTKKIPTFDKGFFYLDMKRDWVVLSLNRSDKSSKTSCVDWSTQGPDQNKNTFNYKMGAKKKVQLFAVSFLFK